MDQGDWWKDDWSFWGLQRDKGLVESAHIRGWTPDEERQKEWEDLEGHQGAEEEVRTGDSSDDECNNLKFYYWMLLICYVMWPLILSFILMTCWCLCLWIETFVIRDFLFKVVITVITCCHKCNVL